MQEDFFKFYEIFATFGEEERAGTIADAILGARRLKPIQTTGDLTAIVEAVVPKGMREKTLSRVFQALRITVNDEMAVLREGLSGAANVLVSGGRLVAISFHSLEDRIVKTFFRQTKMGIITKDPMRATEEEQQRNRRSRSAKLRVAEAL